MNSNSDNAILVTGGAGFIGSHLLDALLSDEYYAGRPIVCIDKLSYAGDPTTTLRRCDRYTFIEADICDAGCVEELLAKYSVSSIFHLAAETHVDRSIDTPITFVTNNIIGTQIVLEAARKHAASLPTELRTQFRFINVSTDEVYGSLANGQADEHAPLLPNSPYSASKASADMLARAYHQTYSLPVVTIRAANNYGPRQFPEKLVPLMVLSARDKKPLPIYGDGQQIRMWLHVRDHVSALLLAEQNGQPGSVYNIGGQTECSNLSTVQQICARVDQRTSSNQKSADLIQFVADRPGHDTRYSIDSTKASVELGWSPKVDFASGLSETVDWYLDNAAWTEQVQARSRYTGARLGKPRD